MKLECNDGGRKCPARLADDAVACLYAHYKRIGVVGEGKWAVSFIKVTGACLKAPVVFKRLDKTAGYVSLLYQVMPGDRGSSCLVSVKPPPGYDTSSIVSKEEVEEDPSVDPEAPQEGKARIEKGHVYPATISSHEAHGMHLDIHGTKAWVPLNDFSPEYDRKSMNTFPIGSKIPKVLVCEADDKSVVCSLRVEAVLETDHARDVFTGAVGEDGTLQTAGWILDHNRIFDLIYDLAVASVDAEYWMSKDAAVDSAIAHLKTKYRATSVDRRSVAVLMSKLCKPTTAIPEAVLLNDFDGYRIAAFAIKECGADDHPKDIKPVIESEEVVVITEPPETREPEEAPRLALPTLFDVSMFFGKVSRLSELESQLAALEMEKSEIEDWLTEHDSVKSATKDFQSVLDELRGTVKR